MSEALPEFQRRGGNDHSASVTVRYWASIRAAAGVDAEQVVCPDSGTTLADVVAAIVERHPDRRFNDQVRLCSVLVGSLPVGGRKPAEVRIDAGSTVEFLPPFAGG